MLDEVMVSVTCGELGPVISGVVYCSVIGACHERFDLGRAAEWTAALAAWCDAHPDMVPFRGQCLALRSQLLQLRGEWDEAFKEAERASSRSGDPAAGAAFYQLGELYRLRGDLRQSDDNYKRASQLGRPPYPGLALLHLAEGDVEAAAAATRQAIQEARTLQMRVPVLRSAVEIFAASSDLSAAQAAADELQRLAVQLDAPWLRAASAHAAGLLALTRSETDTACAHLREAWTGWCDIGAPYDAARARVLIGLACRQTGDEEGARLELESAADVFEQLCAATDVARVASLLATAPGTDPSPDLTGREIEVLRLVASGKTNRAIAGELAISEKTVARHLSNIFTKLDLPSRSAATAYAYNHKLV
jgi:DNA-binding CsgD family transcriptional regulator